MRILLSTTTVCRREDYKSKIVYQPLPQDNPMQRKPIIDLAKQELKWEPKVQLAEGLIKTIEYFKNRE